MNGITPNNRPTNPVGKSQLESAIGEKQVVNESQSAAQRLAQMHESARASLPADISLQPMQQAPVNTTPFSMASISLPASVETQAAPIQVSVENVELENHVSMQIFTSAQTRNSNKVVMFLHGGPGLLYNDSFKPVTDYFVGHGYTLIAPEIAGSGKPGLKDASNSHTQNYVRDMKAVIQCLRERPDMQGKEVCVVAHSWGGFQLASLMTDEKLGKEDRQFFRQAVFIAANLDSAQTRLFGDAVHYNDQSNGSLLSFERFITDQFRERHLGTDEELPEFEKMTETNNPLIDQSLNEKFSPFYRLEQLPLETPCLFIHAVDDKSVPVSQSVDAYAKIRNAGGRTGIVIASEGGHGFFKAGKDHRAHTTANCFGAIDSFIKRPDALNTAMIDDTCMSDASALALEEKLKEKVATYESASRALQDFHQGLEAPSTDGAKRIPSKKTLLNKLKEAHEWKIARNRQVESRPAQVARETSEMALSRIMQALKKE